MRKHQITEDQKLAHQEPDWLENLRGNFDAEVHLPADISREFFVYGAALRNREQARFPFVPRGRQDRHCALRR